MGLGINSQWLRVPPWLVGGASAALIAMIAHVTSIMWCVRDRPIAQRCVTQMYVLPTAYLASAQKLGAAYTLSHKCSLSDRLSTWRVKTDYIEWSDFTQCNRAEFTSKFFNFWRELQIFVNSFHTTSPWLPNRAQTICWICEIHTIM